MVYEIIPRVRSVSGTPKQGRLSQKGVSERGSVHTDSNAWYRRPGYGNFDLLKMAGKHGNKLQTYSPNGGFCWW